MKLWQYSSIMAMLFMILAFMGTKGDAWVMGISLSFFGLAIGDFVQEHWKGK